MSKNKNYRFDSGIPFAQWLIAKMLREVSFRTEWEKRITLNHLPDASLRIVFTFIKDFHSKYPTEEIKPEHLNLEVERLKNAVEYEDLKALAPKLWVEVISESQFQIDQINDFIKHEEAWGYLYKKLSAENSYERFEPEEVCKKLQAICEIEEPEVKVPDDEPRGLFEILQSKDKEPDWLIKPLMARGDTGYLTADPKVGKTILGEQLTLCLAFGIPFLNLEVKKPRRVYYLRFELSDYRFNQHLRTLMSGLMKQDKKRRVQPEFEPKSMLKKPFDLLKQEDFDWLCRQMDKYEPDLLITDPTFKLSKADLKFGEEELIRRKDEFTVKYPSLCWEEIHHQVKQYGKSKDDDSWGTSYGGQRLWADMDFQMKLKPVRESVMGQPSYFWADFRTNDEPIGSLYLRRDPVTLLYTVETASISPTKSEEKKIDLYQCKIILERLLAENPIITQKEFKAAIQQGFNEDASWAYRKIKDGEDLYWVSEGKGANMHYSVRPEYQSKVTEVNQKPYQEAFDRLKAQFKGEMKSEMTEMNRNDECQTDT